MDEMNVKGQNKKKTKQQPQTNKKNKTKNDGSAATTNRNDRPSPVLVDFISLDCLLQQHLIAGWRI
jgi:hypothetical protein